VRLSYLTKTCTPLWERNLESDLEPGKDPEILSIHCRAQDVTPGGLFIAIKGLKADGHDYIDQAIKNGAVAVVVERHIKTHVRTIAAKNTRRAMSAVSARFYGDPCDKLVLVGISGTNGKTTTSWIVEQILKAAGFETGVIGTINWRYRDKVAESPVTTPESMDLQQMLATMVKAGVTHVVMEVSSHGLDLYRVRDCFFDTAIFTNLTQDHLDYHKTMSAYWACKKKLYTRQLARGNKNGRAVINIDDTRGAKLATTLSLPPITTGIHDTAGVRALDITEDISGIKGTLDIGGIKTAFTSSLTGAFNLENILSAAGGAHALGIAPDIICRGIEACKGVPGRLERVPNHGNRFIFVDYAHTPDALESILKTLKLRAPARVITVFGCGGDRDKSKRPLMGQIAVTYSDIAMVTSDNPRTESPEAIIQDILEGMTSSPGSHQGVTWVSQMDLNHPSPILAEPDRKKALFAAVALSCPGDIIIAAGKGHETYQVTARGTIDFDDRKVLKQAIKQANWNRGGNA
jgi:UDP-N-acetylmuramyl-tripeptide synthetase